jgi:O-antigen ligase
MWLAVVCVSLCGAFGALLWWAMKWPLAPILRVVLVATFSVKLEVNLFPIFKYHEGLPGLNISLMLIISLLLLGARILDRWRGKPYEPVMPLSFSLASGAMFLWLLVSILDSSELRLGFYALWGLAATLLMCVVVANEFSDREALRAAAITIAVGMGLSSLIGLLQSTTGMFSVPPWLGAVKEESRQAIGAGAISRVSAFLGSANTFGWYLVTFLPAPLSMLILRVEDFRGWRRLLLALCSTLAVIALILTYARGSWIVFCLSLLALAALAYRALHPTERRRFALRVAAVALLVALLCLPFAGTIYLRLTEDDRGAAASRVSLMQVAQEMIADNPWLGVGLANYEAEMRRYDQTPDRITDGFDYPVHNIFLHMAAEGGIPAVLCFLMLMMIALRRGWRAMGSRDLFLRALAVGLCIGLLAYLANGFKELGSFGAPQGRMPYLLCGLLIALDRARRREEEGVLTNE